MKSNDITTTHVLQIEQSLLLHTEGGLFLDPPCTLFFLCHRTELRWESLGRTFPPAGTSWSRDTESRMGSQFYHRNGPRAVVNGGYENLKLHKICGLEPMNLGNHRYPLCLVNFFYLTKWSIPEISHRRLCHQYVKNGQLPAQKHRKNCEK